MSTIVESTWLPIVYRAIATALLLAGTIEDVRTKRVSPLVTWSLVALALVVRAIEGQWILPVFLVALIFLELVPITWRLVGLGAVFLAASVWSSVAQEPTVEFVVLCWSVTYFFWQVHIIGGADARVFMGLIGLFPNVVMLFSLLGSVFLVALVWLLVLYRKQALSLLATAAGNMRKLEFPSKEELAKAGRPTLPMLTLGGLAYMWILSWIVSLS